MSNYLPSAAISNHKGIQVRCRILHFHDVAPFFAFVPRTSLNGFPCPISTKWFIRPWVEEKRKPSLNIAYFFVSSVREYSAAAFVKARESPDALTLMLKPRLASSWTNVWVMNFPPPGNTGEDGDQDFQTPDLLLLYMLGVRLPKS